jgi:hypothetical protein
MYKYPTANNIQNATAATGLFLNWSNETGNAFALILVSVI